MARVIWLVTAFLLAAGCACPQTSPQLAGCAVFPADNVWNVRVDALPLDAASSAYVATIGANLPLHPDFGALPYGIPYAIVPGDQPKVPVTFDYAGESDPGPYPIPPNPPIEAGSDHHILLLDRDHCLLYELYDASQSNGAWHAGSGAIFDLKSNALRPDTWTSADAAGLPILPGLARYEEVAAGEIHHAIRLTVPQTRNAYLWPARHYASSLTGAAYPPMGQRFRLRADFDASGFSRDGQVILRALKKYGIILADNGSPWYITGAPDLRWDIDTLVTEMRRVKGSDFEAVDSSGLMADANSAGVRSAAWNPPVVNAANYRPGPVSPGELISIFGSNLGPAEGAGVRLNDAGLVDTTLGGTQVLFDGVAAPLLYARADQVNAVVPFGVALKTSTLLEVEYLGASVFSATLDVRPAMPGLFTMDASGSGAGAVLNQDYSVNSPANPAGRGSYLYLWATGGGQTDPAGVDGQLLSGGVLPRTLANVSVRIGGIPATDIYYAGGAPQLVAGVLQVDVRVPMEVAPGPAVPLLVTLDGINSQGDVTVAVR